jgi:hypothetical protein
MPEVSSRAGDAEPGVVTASHTVRTRRFLGGRTLLENVAGARGMEAARQQHAAMLAQQAASPQLSSLSALSAAKITCHSDPRKINNLRAIGLPLFDVS